MHTLHADDRARDRGETISTNKPKRRKHSLRVRVAEPEPRHLTITGRQTCRTLLALIDGGERGTTALEVSTWALRMSHYISELRHRWGLNILTTSEAHDGGEHGRYILIDRVSIDPAEAQ